MIPYLFLDSHSFKPKNPYVISHIYVLNDLNRMLHLINKKEMMFTEVYMELTKVHINYA